MSARSKTVDIAQELDDPGATDPSCTVQPTSHARAATVAAVRSSCAATPDERPRRGKQPPASPVPSWGPTEPLPLGRLSSMSPHGGRRCPAMMHLGQDLAERG